MCGSVGNEAKRRSERVRERRGRRRSRRRRTGRRRRRTGRMRRRTGRMRRRTGRRRRRTGRRRRRDRRRWVEEVENDSIERGILQKRRVKRHMEVSIQIPKRPRNRNQHSVKS